MQLLRKKGQLEITVENIMGWLDVVKGYINEGKGVILSIPLKQGKYVLLLDME